MTADQTFVIAGASLAGAKAAEALREEGFEGRVVLIGAEDERPYERPPLSKEYLLGEAGREKVYVHEEGFYAEHEIELLAGRTAVGLDTAARELALDDGERLRYDRLLLTTGAEPRRLPIPGGDLDGVHYLRSVEDSDARHPFYAERIRVEHWANALHQGPVAARSMLGIGDAYARLPYFFSDQYDVGMEYSGFAREWDRVVFRGDPASREFIAFWLHGDRLVAGMNVNVWDVSDSIQSLIRERVSVDDRQLAALDVPLE